MMSPRVHTRIPVAFVSPKEGKTRWTDWIAHRSAFIFTDSAMPPMDLLRMRFTLPLPDGTTRSVALHGVIVRYVRRTPTTAGGVEVAFFAKGGAEGRQWDQFIDDCRREGAPPESCVRLTVAGAAVAERSTGT
jgi:hypothetical protein